MEKFIYLQCYLFSKIKKKSSAGEILNAVIILDSIPNIDIKGFYQLFPYGEDKGELILDLLHKQQYISINNGLFETHLLKKLFSKAEEFYYQQDNPQIVVF